MAERLLCKCISCLKENPDGIQLPLNSYNHHRRKQQEFSKREDFEFKLKLYKVEYAEVNISINIRMVFKCKIYIIIALIAQLAMHMPIFLYCECWHIIQLKTFP